MSAVVSAHVACNLCGGHEVTVLSRRSRSGAPLRTVACTGCGLVWSDPRPHAVRPFYEEDYRLQYKGTFRPRPKHVLRAGRVALDRFARIRELLPSPRRVLDVGSGGGEFAYLLKSRGHDVVGVEPNRGYAGFARDEYGLEIREGFIGDVALPAQAFGLITVWHVLEHTEDPGAVLRQLRAALQPQGRLVVEVPNVEARCQSPRSSFHEAHLYTFSPATLERLGAAAGLACVQSSLSADGGNITMVFAPAGGEHLPADGLRIPGHHARVAAIVKAHTPWAHAMSVHPWRRAAGRLARALGEAWQVRGARAGKPQLDALYAAGLEPGRPPLRRAWAWLLPAYGLAVAAEEVLLDAVLPGTSFAPQQGLLLYLGLQACVIVALAWAFRARLQTRRGLVIAGAWAAPLLAVPAVC